MEATLIAIIFVLLITIAFYYYLTMSSTFQDRVQELKSLSHNPLMGISFDESFNSNTLMDRFIQHEMENVEDVFRQVYAPEINIGKGVKFVESIKLIKEHDEIIWELSKEGKKLLKQGKVVWKHHKKTGKYLPTVNGKGRWIEQIKGRNPTKAAKALNISTVVVNAAHVISGADVVKKLNEANKKLDELIAYREIDRMSHLEELYYELCEIKWSNLNDSEIYRLRSILNSMRQEGINIRREMHENLSLIKDPRESWFKRTFYSDEKCDKIILDQVFGIRKKMKTLQYTTKMSLGLSKVLYLDLDQTALKSEIIEMEKVLHALGSVESKLMSHNPHINIDAEKKYLLSIKETMNYFKEDYFNSENSKTEPKLVEAS